MVTHYQTTIWDDIFGTLFQVSWACNFQVIWARKKKPLAFHYNYWLFNRDPYHALLYLSYKWVGFHPRKIAQATVWGPFFRTLIYICLFWFINISLTWWVNLHRQAFSLSNNFKRGGLGGGVLSQERPADLVEKKLVEAGWIDIWY